MDVLTSLSTFLCYSTFTIILDFNLPMNNLWNIFSLPFFHLLSSKDHFPPYFRAPFTWITKVIALPPACQLQTPCSLAIISSRPAPQPSYYNSPNRPLPSTHCEPYHFSSYRSSTLISSFLSSVQFSHSVMSNSLWPHGLQHTRPPCPSPTPRVYSNLCPLSWWCHPTISSSVVPFSSHLQSFPASGSFPMSQLFASGGQSIGISESASVLPMNSHDWFPLGWAGWISLQCKGLSRVFSNTIVQKHQFFGTQLSLESNTWLLEKP